MEQPDRPLLIVSFRQGIALVRQTQYCWQGPREWLVFALNRNERLP